MTLVCQTDEIIEKGNSAMNLQIPRLNRVLDHPMKTDLSLLTLRLTAGGLMAGHGAQKLFGAFGGYGLEGTTGWLESLGLKPGKFWAAMAGGTELGSGMLTALGLLNPIGPLMMFGPMVTAWATVHVGKPIWTTSGGAEEPLLYMAAAQAVAVTGPGRFSLDHMLGIKVPTPVTALAVVGVAGGIVAGLVIRSGQPEPLESEVGDESDDQDVETDLALHERAVGT
jgi:putative oxidoreductase